MSQEEIQKIYNQLDSAHGALQDLLEVLGTVFDFEEKTRTTDDLGAIGRALENIEMHTLIALQTPDGHAGMPRLGIEPALEALVELGAKPDDLKRQLKEIHGY